MTTNGIDVSDYQGPQDWTAHKQQGVAFAFAKASEGQHSRDARFDTHISGILKAQLVAGAYHFAWPNQDPAAEAANYIAAVAPYRAHSLVHWLDLEPYSDRRNYAGRNDTQILAWVTEWLATVQAAFPGQRVGVYTSADDIAHGHLPAGALLWYPRYPGSAVNTYTQASAATWPKPSGRVPLFWQFTGSPLDRSLCSMNATQLRAWATGAASPEYQPYPGREFFLKGSQPAYGMTSVIFTAMGQRLVEVGCGRYRVGPGPKLGKADVASYEAWQRQYNSSHHKGWTGSALKWPPGPETWTALKVPKSAL